VAVNRSQCFCKSAKPRTNIYAENTSDMKLLMTHVVLSFTVTDHTTDLACF
jgi:hypothetical protein